MGTYACISQTAIGFVAFLGVVVPAVVVQISRDAAISGVGATSVNAISAAGLVSSAANACPEELRVIVAPIMRGRRTQVVGVGLPDVIVASGAVPRSVREVVAVEHVGRVLAVIPIV